MQELSKKFFFLLERKAGGGFDFCKNRGLQKMDDYTDFRILKKDVLHG